MEEAGTLVPDTAFQISSSSTAIHVCDLQHFVQELALQYITGADDGGAWSGSIKPNCSSL